VRFTTIYPGWYRGRAVHLHFKIRSGSGASSAHEFTSQLFFDDALTDDVHTRQPYVAKGRRDVRNHDDGIYREGGSQLVLAVSPSGNGYAGAFDVAMQL
jgi:protocatechuate 3,4-dioxygenase beta subunit